MTNEELERLTKLKNEIERIEGVLQRFNPQDNRYGFRKLFFPKQGSKDVKWGHSYGLDQVQFDLELEDTIAIVDHFKRKLERLKKEFNE